MMLWCGVCVCVCEAPTVKCQVRRVSMQWWWLQAGAVQMYAALYIYMFGARSSLRVPRALILVAFSLGAPCFFFLWRPPVAAGGRFIGCLVLCVRN